MEKTEILDEKENKKPSDVELTRVVKETEFAYKLPDETLVTKEEYLVWLGQQIWEIKKAVA